MGFISTTPLTELEAVNSLLSAIGEAAVSSLETATTVEVTQAKNLLSNVNRETQQKGWHFNTEWDVTLTRDSDNKTHAQFTNLISQPNAADDEVKLSVNNMLKAITASLLMEQVLAPNWKFKTKVSDDDKAKPGEIKIRGLKEPSSQRVKDITGDDLPDLKN